MRNRNLTRLEIIEHRRGVGEVLQADAWMLEDGRFRVMVFGSDKLSGVYTQKQYDAFAAREDVFLVEVVVRDKVA